ncbi:MAG: hypothetical protein GY950_00790 [bacterium]|nr:hypothetical protein [bacterium]
MYANYAAVTPAHAPGEGYTSHAGLGVITSVGGFGQDELLYDMVYPGEVDPGMYAKTPTREELEKYYPGEFIWSDDPDFVGPPEPIKKPSDTDPYVIKTPTVWAEAPKIPWWLWAIIGVTAYKAIS